MDLGNNAVTMSDGVSSEGTLVEKPTTPADNEYLVIDSQEKEQQVEMLEDKENLSPTKEELRSLATPESPLNPLGESSPSRINEQGPPNPPKQSIETEEPAILDSPMNDVGGPPNRPPPVPPRQKPADKQEEIQREVEFGAQQDVTEAISNVLFQLQCAIKAESVDESGEQIDRIKKLFFGKLKATTTDKDGKARTKEEFFSDIKVQVSDPRDIYDALDAAFDEEEVEVGTSRESQFTTISILPPILQIHVSRAQFNKEKGTPFKSNHHLAFRETIFMDRYMDTDDKELRQRKSDCWSWKKDLIRMEKQENELRKTNVSQKNQCTKFRGSDAFKAQSSDSRRVESHSRLLEAAPRYRFGRTNRC